MVKCPCCGEQFLAHNGPAYISGDLYGSQIDFLEHVVNVHVSRRKKAIACGDPFICVCGLNFGIHLKGAKLMWEHIYSMTSKERETHKLLARMHEAFA